MSQKSEGLVFNQSEFFRELQKAISTTGSDLGTVIGTFQEEFHESVYLYSGKKSMVYKFGDNPSRTRSNLAYNFKEKQFYIFVGTGTDVWVEIESNLNERYPKECFQILRNYNNYQKMNSWKKWWRGRKLLEENNQILSEMVVNSVKEFLLETSTKSPKELLIDWNIPFKYFSVSNKKEKFLTIFEVLKDCDYLIDNDSSTFSQFIYHALNSITVRDEEEATSEFDTEMTDELICFLLYIAKNGLSKSLRSAYGHWTTNLINSLKNIFYYFEEEYNILALELVQIVKERIIEINKDESLAQTISAVVGIATTYLDFKSNYQNVNSELSKYIFRNFYWKTTIELLMLVEQEITTKK